MSIAGLAVLAYQVHPDVILLCSGSCLPQLQVTDLAVCFGCFKPPLAEPAFHAGYLELLVEEVDLATERLALLVHSAVSIDFCHETQLWTASLSNSRWSVVKVVLLPPRADINHAGRAPAGSSSSSS